MKMFRKLLSVAFVMASALTAFTACSSEDILSSKTQADKDGLRTITMKLVGGCEQYGAKVKSRAGDASVDWEDGAKLYLQFSNGDKLVSGNATYNKASDEWTVSYYGSLATDENATCQAYYFDNTTVGNGEVVQLSANSAIYEDTNGAYVFDGENLTVKANLTPKTGRMRFTGAKGTELVLTGITHYASYDPASNTFFTSISAVNATVDNDSGYTPYIYGYFTNVESPTLGLVANGNEAYTMSCPSTMYQTGDSGYLDVPTVDSHNGWATGLTFTVNGVSFKMMPVEYNEGNFLIGETEVTEDLYDAVLENDESRSSHLPLSNISTTDYNTFRNKLSSIFGVTFRNPTTAEWQYAFKGGKKSLNYTYSGSNNVDDVAWYNGNASSKQPVKTKQPNELGLYDMSGNVYEWTVSGNYYDSPYGGSYQDSSSSMKYDSYCSSYLSGREYIGFRLALTL